jgi:hypothetical protein
MVEDVALDRLDEFERRELLRFLKERAGAMRNLSTPVSWCRLVAPARSMSS